jgi:hypothetical protein
MGLRIAATWIAFAAAPALMQNGAFAQMTGVSRPDSTPIMESPDAMPAPAPTKPAAGIPMSTTTSTPKEEVYGPYVPYKGPVIPAPTTSKAAFDPDGAVVTSAGPRLTERQQWTDGVVTSVPERAGEIGEGTLLKARITKELSTESTAEGSTFRAELTEPVMKDGRVILPVGAALEGRVTEIRSGKRILGRAMMHLEPRSVTLPDGTQYILHAQLIDMGENKHVKIGSEGDVLRKDHPKETLAVVGGVTGTGAVVGAVAGGGVGAVVGASIGAAAGTIVWLKQDLQATLPENSLLIFSLTLPMELKPLHLGTAGGQ